MNQLTLLISRTIVLFSVVLFHGATLEVVTAAPPAAKPNIVIYLSDDHGVDFVGCYGNSVIKTPNLDALAADGVRMTRMFAATSTCAPSRAVFYTGLYPARNGTMANHSSSKPGVKSLPTYLKKLGYRVVLANKRHIAPVSVFDFEFVKATLPGRKDRPRYFRSEGLDVAQIDELLKEHAQERADEPLCLILADDNPHVAWEKNKDYDPAKLSLSPILVDTPETRGALANYYQDITTMDQRLGQVRASLKQHGFDQNTLFIYTSDQGSEWPHAKWTVYDAGLRVPFLAVWPGRIQPGTKSDAMISFVDMTPTLVDIAGGELPEGLDGRSCLKVLQGEQPEFRRWIYATHTGDSKMNNSPQRGVRDARYKYVLNLRPESRWKTHFTELDGIPESHRAVYGTWLTRAKSDSKVAKLIQVIEHHDAEELYDTVADPYELDNLATDPKMQARLGTMRARLKSWMVSTGDEGLKTEAEQAARHQATKQKK